MCFVWRGCLEVDDLLLVVEELYFVFCVYFCELMLVSNLYVLVI